LDFTGVNKSWDERYGSILATRLEEEDLRILLSYICPELEERIIQDILGLANDPSGYFKKHGERFLEDGYDVPSQHLYRRILVSAMRDLKKIVVLDWKMWRDDISWAVSDLTNGEISNIVGDLDEEEDTLKALCIAEARLSKRGLAFLHLDTDSDEYSLLVVPQKQAESVFEAAERCSLQIIPVGRVRL
jgi:hypothetical protein